MNLEILLFLLKNKSLRRVQIEIINFLANGYKTIKNVCQNLIYEFKCKIFTVYLKNKLESPIFKILY